MVARKRGARDRSKVAAFLISVTILVACSALYTEICLLGENSLYLNDRWIVGKRMMEAGLGGGDEFLINRDAIAGGYLSLGAGLGLQQVYLRQEIQPRRLQAEVRFSEDHLDIFYNRNAVESAGIRLSRSRVEPSFSFQISHDGKFLSKTPLSVPKLGEGWHEIDLAASTHGAQLRIDGSGPIEVPRGFSSGSIGFAGNVFGYVRSIRVDSVQGSFSEDFRNRRNWAQGMALHFSLLLLFAYGLSAASARTLVPTLRHVLTVVTAAGLSLLVLGLIWWGFDTRYWSRQPFQGSTHSVNGGPPPPLSRDGLDALRFHAFGAWFRLFGGESVSHEGIARRGYPMARFWAGPSFCPASGDCDASYNGKAVRIPPKAPGTYRLLLIGTSQAVGTGAETIEKTFFARLHHKLAARMAAAIPSVKLESLNWAQGGRNADFLFQLYPEQIERDRPDLVLIDLGNNDEFVGFEQRMRRYLDLNQAKGLRTVLILEANCPDFGVLSHLDGKHEILRRLGAEYKLPVLPFHEHFAVPEVAGSGILWWDWVHLTSWGHEVAAEWLAQKIAPIIIAAPRAHR